MSRLRNLPDQQRNGRKTNQTRATCMTQISQNHHVIILVPGDVRDHHPHPYLHVDPGDVHDHHPHAHLHVGPGAIRDHPPVQHITIN